MYCPKCGTQNDDNAFRCVSCGQIIQQIPLQPRSVPIENDQAMRMIIMPALNSKFLKLAFSTGLYHAICV